MSTTIKAERQSETGIVRPCTAANIVYKAYKRPYDGGAPVLTLLASCEYGSAPWEIYFTAVPGETNVYQLMEKVPGVVYWLHTYYSTTYCSGYGLAELGDTVVIEDARGRHTVSVEPI